MAYDFTMIRRVEFSDTDMAGIMHFANYFRFIESAEHAFFRSLGLTIHGSDDDGMFGWARVHASCDYRAPLHYPDVVQTHLFVTSMGERSLGYTADLRRCDSSGEPISEPVARAFWKTVFIQRSPADHRMKSAPIPSDVAAEIQVAPPEVLNLLGKDNPGNARANK